MNITIKNLPEVLDFTVNGKIHSVATSDLPEVALRGLFLYGRRKVNDTYNSRKNGENPLTADEVIDLLKTGALFAGRTAAPKMHPVERWINDRLIEMAVKQGLFQTQKDVRNWIKSHPGELPVVVANAIDVTSDLLIAALAEKAEIAIAAEDVSNLF